MKRLTTKALLLSFVCLGIMAVGAANPNISISADELTFDGKTNLAEAKGNVVISDLNKRLTGNAGWYNLSTTEAFLDGGITMIGDNLSLRAQSVHAINNSEFSAQGGVYLERGGQTLQGDNMTYNILADYGTASGNVYLTSGDMSIRTGQMEGWFRQIKILGSGGVELYSGEHNLTAHGDRIEYTQTPGKDDGRVYLFGNARAVQNGNTLEGEGFDIWLEDGSIQTKGRSTLVIKPR